MEPVTILALATSAWNLISPYAMKLAGKMGEKAAEALPEAVGKLWEAVKAKFETQPGTQSLPADLVKEPEAAAVQGAFQYQLQKLLENDAAFAQQIEKLVKEAQGGITTYAATQGDGGAIAQGPGAKAVGKSGVMVGGNVTGNINTGNQHENKNK